MEKEIDQAGLTIALDPSGALQASGEEGPEPVGGPSDPLGSEIDLVEVAAKAANGEMNADKEQAEIHTVSRVEKDMEVMAEVAVAATVAAVEDTRPVRETQAL